MKKQRKRIKKNKECPYCSFFKPCGNCEANRQNDPKYIGPVKKVSERNDR